MLNGKGFYIWNIQNTEGGDIPRIVSMAREAGLSHVLVKIADGIQAFNIRNGVDLAFLLVDALQDAGIEVWGWQYIYGNLPAQEAAMAARRIQQTGVTGFVINAEKEMKGKPTQAAAYLNALKSAVSIPLGLSSYRWPSYHPDFPWVQFLSRVDVNLPQVYWLQAHNPSYQLQRTFDEFRQSRYPQVPIIPTGAAFLEYGWYPTPDEIEAFLLKAQGLADGANFWVWENTRKYCSNLWEVIKSHDWANPPVPEPEPVPEVSVPKVTILVDGLNVRSGPGTNYSIVRKVNKGTQIHVLDIDGATLWAQIAPGEWVAVTLNNVMYSKLEIQ